MFQTRSSAKGIPHLITSSGFLLLTLKHHILLFLVNIIAVFVSATSACPIKVDLAQSESRILRIARGSGTHPDEVRGLLKLHKHFEKVFGKVGKNMKGEASKMKQFQVHGGLNAL